MPNLVSEFFDSRAVALAAKYRSLFTGHGYVAPSCLISVTARLVWCRHELRFCRSAQFVNHAPDQLDRLQKIVDANILVWSVRI